MDPVLVNGAYVLVTGASSGIGRATVELFARADAKVIAADVDERGLARLKRELAAQAIEVEVETLDVADRDAFERLAERLASQRRLPQVLVNNAGIGYLGATFGTPRDVWRRVFEVNFYGVLNGCEAFGPRMVASGEPGRIVNVGSMDAVRPPPNMSACAAAKAAVGALSASLALELANTQVGVSCVYPGVTNTPIVRARSAIAPDIANAQIDRLQASFQKVGAHPRAVAEAILRAVREQRETVFVGPKMGAAPLLQRLLPSSLRKALSVSHAKDFGYLPRDPE